jgi:redox-sensitive bicupin YhaK (pirin superfamily)
MIDVIRSEDRGTADLGWLQSRHTFSFADYQNPERVNFGPLRVVNEDWIAAGKGFGTHPHEDMEIITYMLDGELEHKDSMGNGSVIRPGEVQRMTAGTGVRHSEFNPSGDTPAHLLQIWLFPEENGLQPGYEQEFFAPELKQNQWCLVGSRDGRDGSLTIHQDVNLYAATLQESQSIEVELHAGRNSLLHIVRGQVTMNDEELVAGDAVTIEGRAALTLRASEDSEMLLFDMP